MRLLPLAFLLSALPASSFLPAPLPALSSLPRRASASDEGQRDEGHKPPPSAASLPQSELDLQATLSAHQQSAPRLSFPASVRSLVANQHGYAVLSTNSASSPSYPSGSVVGFCLDDAGSPCFLFSTMSGHTQDVLADPKCSLTVAAGDFKGAADGRVTLTGQTARLPAAERGRIEELYLQKHPGAFWASFGDFSFFRLAVESVRFVGGFARAGSFEGDEYYAAEPDPVAPFSAGVAGHMNADHSGSTAAMVEHYVGVGVEAAKISAVDSLGMDVVCERTPEGGDKPQSFKIRLPFVRKAEDRKMVKDIIVEMTRAAAAAQKE